MNQTRIAELQLNSLRDALDRAGKSAAIAEGRARRALNDLQIERGRSARIEQKLNETMTRLEAASDENRRLRDLVGSVCKEHHVTQHDLALAASGQESAIEDAARRGALYRTRYAA